MKNQLYCPLIQYVYIFFNYLKTELSIYKIKYKNDSETLVRLMLVQVGYTDVIIYSCFIILNWNKIIYNFIRKIILNEVKRLLELVNIM